MVDKKVNEEYASLALKRFFDTATENIQTSALVSRALTDKISTETINQKVNSQLNSIHASMYKINSKFNEKSKNYNVVKKEILDVLTDYELALTEYSDYYDYKLEELILKKVELESHLVGKIFREENFKSEENEKAKQTDKLKSTFAETTKRILEKFSIKKKENQINVQDISRMQDCLDLEQEQIRKLDKKVEKVQEKNRTNMSEIIEIEKEIKKISSEINSINEKKKLALEAAMETKDKWIATTVKKTHTFARITKFFANRFNTSKVISKTVIVPLRQRIEEFRMTELADIKG